MSNSSSSLSPSSPPSRDHHVSEGDVCIVDFGEGRQYFLTACRSGKDNQVKLGQKGKVYTTGLIGLPYGAVIEVKNSRMVRTEDDLITPPLNLEDADADGDTPSVKLDNRNLVDDNKSQITTQDDIMKLREEGKTGQDIVTELVNNSKSFKGKTEFAKAKYIKRKLKKYLPRARIVRCTSSTVCDVYFKKDAMRYMSLRPDSLAQIISYANVYAGAQVLTFDTISVVTASLVERMGGYGRILSVHSSQDPPHKEVLSKFNFDYKTLDVLKFVSAFEIFDPKSKEDKDKDACDDEKQKLKAQGWPVPLMEHTIDHLEKDFESDQAKHDFLFKRASRFIRKLCRPSRDETLEYLNKKSDSLIISTKFDPLPILLALLPFLAPSCPFVVFSEHIEPLAECFEKLKSDRLAIQLQLTETWNREIKVMQNITHPQMTMSATGGYILTGCKVSDQCVEVEKKGKLVGKGFGAMRARGRGNKRKLEDVAAGGDADREDDDAGGSS
ncbi:hypothetical protein TrST_g13881 [Triparma strigata]|uniref:tRNA (adenine(58)-N(1))-methyltransferase non-catalytic subunit TRM6 n=1 Tax=Triparma strigata TaxID=1606541 RepID=A0A9W7B0M0_9STRA|nr:hypothetical protein TrST_g13881 [Triparma strigata]